MWEKYKNFKDKLIKKGLEADEWMYKNIPIWFSGWFSFFFAIAFVSIFIDGQLVSYDVQVEPFFKSVRLIYSYHPRIWRYCYIYGLYTGSYYHPLFYWDRYINEGYMCWDNEWAWDVV